MCRLLEAIDDVGKAADKLTMACAREGALVDTTHTNPLKALLSRQFRTASLTPNDMLTTLGRIK